MTTYQIRFIMEGNGKNNVTNTTQQANNAEEALQKAKDRLAKGKEITLISIKPLQ